MFAGWRGRLETFPGSPEMLLSRDGRGLRLAIRRPNPGLPRNAANFFMGGGAALPTDSIWAPWNGGHVFTTGNVILDLLHNFFLENGARIHKPRVHETVNDPVSPEVCGYLLVRGSVHAAPQRPHVPVKLSGPCNLEVCEEARGPWFKVTLEEQLIGNSVHWFSIPHEKSHDLERTAIWSSGSKTRLSRRSATLAASVTEMFLGCVSAPKLAMLVPAKPPKRPPLKLPPRPPPNPPPQKQLPPPITAPASTLG
jgi:hypothetical protein